MQTISVLSIENAKNWSWGLASGPMREHLERRGFRFVRFVRKPREPIEQDLVDFFDLTLVQNADNMGLIRQNLRKVVCRMGGMVIDDKNRATRYDHWLSLCGAVVSCNSQLHSISSRVNQNAFLVPNAVDLLRFKMKPTELSWPFRKGVTKKCPFSAPALFKGDMCGYKGEDTSCTGMIEDCKKKNNAERFGAALGLTLSKPFTVGFAGNVWGMGGEYKGWQQYAESVIDLMKDGVQQHVCLHNGPGSQRQIPHDEMCESFYWKVDCLILPSINEGCSNVTGEALACGVPVVSTKVGYHGERLVDGGNVLFVERSRESIVKAVKRLMEDDELYLRLSRNGREFVEREQNVEKIARRYEKIMVGVAQNTRH